MKKTISLPSSDLRQAALRDLRERNLDPSPENLVNRSQEEDAPLYEHFSQYTDEDFSEYGRYTHGRKIIDSTKEVEIIAGKKIEYRAVECVQVGDERRWAYMNDILCNPSMTASYFDAIQSSLKQASAKLEILKTLQDVKTPKAPDRLGMVG